MGILSSQYNIMSYNEKEEEYERLLEQRIAEREARKKRKR